MKQVKRDNHMSSLLIIIVNSKNLDKCKVWNKMFTLKVYQLANYGIQVVVKASLLFQNQVMIYLLLRQLNKNSLFNSKNILQIILSIYRNVVNSGLEVIWSKFMEFINYRLEVNLTNAWSWRIYYLV